MTSNRIRVFNKLAKKNLDALIEEDPDEIERGFIRRQLQRWTTRTLHEQIYTT